MDPAVLTGFAARCLEAVGIASDDAALVAEHLVEAELRGLDSHGLSRLPVYVRRIRKGLMEPRTEPEIVRETPVAALMDARHGVGIVAADRAMRMAAAKAKVAGVGCVGVRNSTHCGFLAFYTKRAALEGLIAFACANAAASQAPWGGRQPYFGTNPLSAGIPRRDGPPIVLDMATTVVARSKIRLAACKGEGIPEGWAVDREGRPTTDPCAAMEGLILPVGGPKGYGLALLVDVLSGVFTGGAFGPEVGALAEDRLQRVGHFFLALRADLFVPLEQFVDSVEEMAQQIKACPPMVGFEHVLLPGEPEEIRSEANRRAGITVSDAVVKELEALGGELGVSCPWIR